MGLWKDIIEDCILQDINIALQNKAYAGAMILTYCGIDAMAFLNMPLGQKKVKRGDYIEWVNKYMKTNTSQPYQYKGIDLYGARCGIAHTYGYESELSKKGKCKIFMYIAKNNKHVYDPINHPEKVIICIDVFIRDFFEAVEKFREDIQDNAELKNRVKVRLPKLFRYREIL